MTIREQYIKAYRILRLNVPYGPHATRIHVNIFNQLFAFNPRVVAAAYLSLYAPGQSYHSKGYYHEVCEAKRLLS